MSLHKLLHKLPPKLAQTCSAHTPLLYKGGVLCNVCTSSRTPAMNMKIRSRPSTPAESAKALAEFNQACDELRRLDAAQS